MAWFGNLLYAFGTFGGPLKWYSSGLVALAMVCFVLLHGVQRYGKHLIWQFILTVFIIGWTFETISIVTGIPFGNYHYTELMAPFLGHVPVFVLPAYGVMGYISWSLATLVIGQRKTGLDHVDMIAVPILAAVLMVFWDLSMDPLRATVEGRWIWAEGGAHLGVPGLNYLGWMIVTWLMFQIFAVLVRRAGVEKTDNNPALWWLSIPMIYLSFAVEYLVNPLTGNGVDAVSMVNGQMMPVQDVYTSVALITALTMLPMAGLGALCVRRSNLIRKPLKRLLRERIWNEETS